MIVTETKITEYPLLARGKVRVVAQGDMRPMAGSLEALEDLKLILEGRSAFYAKSDLVFDTSAQPLEASFLALRQQIRTALKLPL